jgi:hypothetical protein
MHLFNTIQFVLNRVVSDCDSLKPQLSSSSSFPYKVSFKKGKPSLLDANSTVHHVVFDIIMKYYNMTEDDYNNIVKIFNKKMVEHEKGNDVVEKLEDNDNEDEDKLHAVKNKKKRKTTTISLSEKQSRKNQRNNE